MYKISEFSISEIKDLLDNYDSTEDLSYYLEEKRAMIAERIKSEKELMKKIDLFLEPKQQEVGL